jgi:hypothetical protein
MKDGLKIHGHLRLDLFGPDGKLKQSVEKDNIIVNNGFDFICDAIGNSSRGAVMGYISIGTSATAPGATQTALLAEAARVAASYSHTSATKVLTLVSSFAAGTGTGALTEAGVLNASSAGTLLNRVTFSTINKAAGDSLTATYTLTLS